MNKFIYSYNLSKIKKLLNEVCNILMKSNPFRFIYRHLTSMFGFVSSLFLTLTFYGPFESIKQNNYMLEQSLSTILCIFNRDYEVYKPLL